MPDYTTVYRFLKRLQDDTVDRGLSETVRRLRQGTLKPGESLSCATGQHTEVMQLIGGSGGSEVVTLNFTKISGNITVQILIGL